MDYVPAIMRWLHLMAGVMWIGLLYYFNFVQVAALKAAAADNTAAGITKHVAPRALFYFRWSALVTWLAGAALLGSFFVAAFTLQAGHVPIGIGAWLGTIMLFNVWGLIWPNQKKSLASNRLRMKRRSRHAASLSWLRVPIRCFRSRCCFSWQPARIRLFTVFEINAVLQSKKQTRREAGLFFRVDNPRGCLVCRSGPCLS